MLNLHPLAWSRCWVPSLCLWLVRHGLAWGHVRKLSWVELNRLGENCQVTYDLQEENPNVRWTTVPLSQPASSLLFRLPSYFVFSSLFKCHFSVCLSPSPLYHLVKVLSFPIYPTSDQESIWQTVRTTQPAGDVITSNWDQRRRCWTIHLVNSSLGVLRLILPRY